MPIFKYALDKFNQFIKKPIDKNDREKFIMACSTGDVRAIELLLSHKKINKLTPTLIGAFMEACWSGRVNIVQYLLTSPNAQIFHNFHIADSRPIYIACQNVDVKLLEYLLTSTELKTHPDIHFNDDLIFKTVFKEKDIDIMRFLICVLNIEKNKNIEHLISNSKTDYPSHNNDFIDNVEKLFEKRNLADKLYEELIPKTVNIIPPTKPKRIKI